MDRSDDLPVRGHRNHVIGVIGPTNLEARHKASLVQVGQILASLNRIVATVPAPGTANAVREGVQLEGGELHDLDSDVIGHADHTFVIETEGLLQRLRAKYPALDTMPNVTLVNDVDELLDVMLTVQEEMNPH